MAVHALQPALAPANPDRVPFNLALSRYAAAVAAQDALASPSFAADLSAADAVDAARSVVETIPAPDAAALATKLRIALAGFPLAPAALASILADVRRLATGARA